VNRLTEMVEEVLMLSRLESDRQAVPLDRVDLRESVREAVQALQPQAGDAGVTVETQVPDEPLHVLGSEEALRRIVGNLLDNAVKYTPEGGQVWARVRRDGDEVVVEVEDNGIGIPAGARERVFERFFRVDAGRSRAAGGTGLGLSIVKHLVQALNGEVGVEASPTGGSLFRVRMRLTEAPREVADPPR
jgi:two-component system phosphate regulon sensor histidine kinase PhoR